MKDMQEFWELTKKFNNISGASNELSEKAFIEQYTYIREEFGEMTNTFNGEAINPTLGPQMLEPLLDDTLDVIITAFGMLQKLENLGVDINAAAIATANNNLSKYPTRPYIAYESVDRFTRDGITVNAVFNEAENCFVLRDASNGKVKKPFDFISNDLHQFITKKVEDKYNGKSC